MSWYCHWDVQEIMNVYLNWWIKDSCQGMLFIWSSLISSMLFSNVVSGSNFADSILLLVIIWSNCYSKDAGSLERCFSCITNCDENVSDVSFHTPVASERYSVTESIGTISFQYCSITDVVFPWNPPILLVFVWKFDQTHQNWLRSFSQSDFQNTEFQMW